MTAIIDTVKFNLDLSPLILRGGFDFGPAEERPAGPSGRPAASVLLICSAGAGWWDGFQRWIDRQPDVMANPLDTWSREILERLAHETGGRVVMPNDRPYQPFQQWATRAEGLRPSPLGILMHPEFGLWHAYRGALLYDEPVGSVIVEEADKSNHLCDACVGKPCMNACPVGAHSLEGFAYERCIDHVRGPDGVPCRERGCLDRSACPYGAAYRYPPEVQAFFQRAFAGLS